MIGNYKVVYQTIIILSIAGLILPSFTFAQEQFGATAPQTIDEAKTFGLTILSKLPEAVKNVWREEALPIWRKMWEWFLGFWNNVAWPFLEPWRQKLVDLLGQEIEKRRPAIEEKIKEEVKEEIKETAPIIGKSLWEKFKDLLGSRGTPAE